MSIMTRKRHSAAARAILAVAAVSALGGCAMKSDIRDLQTEIRTLTASQDSLTRELRMAMASTQDTLRTQSGQLFDFRGEITRVMREIRDEMSQLRALTGENQRGISALQRGGGGGFTTGGGGGAPSGGAPAGGGVSEELPGVGGGSSANQLWEAATQQLSRGMLPTAQRAFEQFIREHPNHERAADAQFFLADILVQQGQPAEALRAFEEVQSRFPNSTRVPDALYRIAILQIEAGNIAVARETLQRIVNTYPETAIALIARDKLEEIG
jgi:tol-pal system protein YbgF